MSRNLIKASLLSAAICLGILGLSALDANAAGTWDQDFENCSGSTTCTDWTFSTGTSATNTANSTATSHDGTHSLRMEKTSSNAVTAHYDAGSGHTLVAGDVVSFWFYKEVATGTAGTRDDISIRDGSSNYRCLISIYGGNIYQGASGGVDIGDYSATTWTHVEIELQSSHSNEDCRYRIDGGSWSSSYQDGSGASAPYTFDVVHFPTTYTHIDDIEVASYADPRPTATASVSIPTTSSTDLTHPKTSVRGVSTVSSVAHPGYSGYFEYQIFKGATVVYDWTVATVGFGSTFTSSCGNYYCSDIVVTGVSWQVGDYDYKTRVCFTGYSCSAWSSAVTVTISPGIGGGDTGSNWDGTGLDQTGLDEIQTLWGGGYTDWQDFLSSYPTFHDYYTYDCDFWGTGTHDGMSCFFDWVRYVIVPSSVQFNDLLRTPMGVLTTRWPFGYIFYPALEFTNGLQNGSDTCPIPTIFPASMSLMGSTVNLPDDWTLCTAFDNADAATVIAANSYASTTLLACVYVGFGLLWYEMARRFLKG